MHKYVEQQISQSQSVSLSLPPFPSPSFSKKVNKLKKKKKKTFKKAEAEMPRVKMYFKINTEVCLLSPRQPSFSYLIKN